MPTYASLRGVKKCCPRPGSTEHARSSQHVRAVIPTGAAGLARKHVFRARHTAISLHAAFDKAPTTSINSVVWRDRQRYPRHADAYHNTCKLGISDVPHRVP